MNKVSKLKMSIVVLRIGKIKNICSTTVKGISTLYIMKERSQNLTFIDTLTIY